jgi:hypothetical protein
MANNVIPTPFFEGKYKRYAKKFASLGSEIEQLESVLIENPQLGISLGSNIYKVRLANKSKGKGKSGGFRVITYLIDKNDNSTDVYLITIFDKSEESSILKAELIKIVKKIFF